tara:strand:- start:105 stop:629 length:525 start_codon:yes stop_codon:yes gene_type:complete
MAGQRLTDKSALSENLKSDDLLMCVDVSDSTGSAAGSSKKILNKYVIQTDTIDMTAANFHSLNSSPITIVGVPGSGFAIIPLGCMIFVDYGTTGTSDRIALSIGHEGTGAYAWGTMADFMRGASGDMVFVADIGGITADSTLDNMALKIHADGNFHGSVDWTAKVYITYQIIKL